MGTNLNGSSIFEMLRQKSDAFLQRRRRHRRRRRRRRRVGRRFELAQKVLQFAAWRHKNAI